MDRLVEIFENHLIDHNKNQIMSNNKLYTRVYHDSPKSRLHLVFLNNYLRD